MRLAVFITAHARPNLLAHLLGQLHHQIPAWAIRDQVAVHSVRTFVLEDPSTADMMHARELLSMMGGTWIQAANHRGKNGYYLTINDVLRLARSEAADVNLLLQDDVHLSSRFLDLVETLPVLTGAHGSSIPDVVFLHRDAYRQDENAVQWTSIRPTDCGSLERIGWIDCVALAFGKLFVTKIDPLRAGVQGTSSGVPAQLSQQCARKSLPMLRVWQSWVKHVGARSVMHETDNEMMRGIRQTVDFIDEWTPDSGPRTPGLEPKNGSQPEVLSAPADRSSPSIRSEPSSTSHSGTVSESLLAGHPNTRSAPISEQAGSREPETGNLSDLFVPPTALPPTPSVRQWAVRDERDLRIPGTGTTRRIAVTWQPQGLGQSAFADGLRAIGFRVEEWKDCVRHLDDGRPVLFHGWFPMLDDAGKRYPGQVVTVWHSGWTGVDVMGEGDALASLLRGLARGLYRVLWLERRDVRPPRVKSLAPVWSPRALEALAPKVGDRDSGLATRRVLLAMCPSQAAAAKNVLAGVMGSRDAAEIHLSKNFARDGRGKLLDLLAEPGAIDSRASPRLVFHEQGSRADAVRLASEMDLVVHPSVTDTWPYFAMEAVYAGTPVVVSDAVAWVHHLSPWARGTCVVPATSSGLLVDVVGRLLGDSAARAQLLAEQRDLLDRLSLDHARSAAATLEEHGFDVEVPSVTSWLREHGRLSRPEPEPQPVTRPENGPGPGPCPASRPLARPRRDRPRVLLLADVPGWAFDVNLRALAEYVTDFDYEHWYVVDKRALPKPHEYDAVYVPYHRWHFLAELDMDRAAGSLRSWWFDPEKTEPPADRHADLVNSFKRFHVVTAHNFAELEKRCPRLEYLTNPVDTRRFSSPGDERRGTDPVVVCWNGNARHFHPSGLDVKGFYSIVLPAITRVGIRAELAEYNTSRVAPEAMPDFYRRANLTLSASLYEGASNSVMEAMACGHAVVTTDVGNMREIQTSQLAHLGATGIQIVERSVDAFAAAVEDLRAKPERVREMGDANALEIRERWSWDVWADRYRAFLRKVLE